MTATPFNGLPSIPCPEKRDKLASPNADERPQRSLLTWPPQMPILNEPKFGPNQNGYPAADESLSSPAAREQTNLPPAVQLSPVPGLSPVDLPLSAQIEKTAAIQQAALAGMRAAQREAIERPSTQGKAKLLGCIEDVATIARTPDRYAAPPAMERPKFNQFQTNGPTVSHNGMAAAIGRNVRRIILATSVFSIAAICLPFIDWPSLPSLPSIVQGSSYVLKRLPNASSDLELKLSRDFDPENSFRIGKSPEQTSAQEAATSVGDGTTGTVKPRATLLHTTAEQLYSDEVKPLLANAGSALGVTAKSQSAQQIEAEGQEIGAARESVATVQTAPQSSQKNNRYFDPQEVKILLLRGGQLMATGDVVAARAMFLRAAETEDPEAALALGAAYDPHVLRRLGVIGIVPDLEKARAWYGKAERLGSIDARYRLENLKR
jgi:hypothetical protein